jgi:hypothetical protein
MNYLHISEVRSILSQRLARHGLESGIAHLLNISTSAVQYTLQQEATRIEGNTLLRSGRPPILSENDRVSIIGIIRRDPFVSYDNIHARSEFNVCNKTFLRRTLLIVEVAGQIATVY